MDTNGTGEGVRRVALTVRVGPAEAVPYLDGLRWQDDAAEALRAGGPESLALIEHEPVYTMGRRGGRSSLLVPPEMLRAPVVDIDRGGDLTWHGPGQLVGYPVLDLRGRNLRPVDYVRRLEALLIDVLAVFGVEAQVVSGRPGVWAAGAKVAAIGVAVRGGITRHGFAINVSPDLSWFGDIVPCGIADAGVTSLDRLLGASPSVRSVPSMPAVVEATARAFERQFDSHLEAGAGSVAQGVTA